MSLKLDPLGTHASAWVGTPPPRGDIFKKCVNYYECTIVKVTVSRPVPRSNRGLNPTIPCISHLGSSKGGSAESPTASTVDLVGSPRIQQICRNKSICKQSVYPTSVRLAMSSSRMEQRSSGAAVGARCSDGDGVPEKIKKSGDGCFQFSGHLHPRLWWIFFNSLFTVVALVAAAARLVTTGVPQNSQTYPSLVFLFEPASPQPNPLAL